MRAGLFGKMPAHGDFVARGDPALIAWFEGWLTRELGGLERDSLDAVLARAPVWRFAVRREGGAVAGALIPSGDQVGRLFPLLLFVECDAGDASGHADAVAALPLDRTTTADEALAMVAGVTPEKQDGDARWPGAELWRNDTGDVLVFDALPSGEDFARLFARAEATA